MQETVLVFWSFLQSNTLGILAVLVSLGALAKSHEANGIARRALKIQERGVEAQIASDERSQRANLRIRPEVEKWSNGERAFFVIENRGAGSAEITLIRFSDGGNTLDLTNLARLAPHKTRRIEVPLRRFLAPIPPGDLLLTITIDYSDGTGDHQLQYWVTVGAGDRFTERKITVHPRQPLIDLEAFYRDF